MEWALDTECPGEIPPLDPKRISISAEVFIEGQCLLQVPRAHDILVHDRIGKCWLRDKILKVSHVGPYAWVDEALHTILDDVYVGFYVCRCLFSSHSCSVPQGFVAVLIRVLPPPTPSTVPSRSIADERLLRKE
jgi:hypothetical protein